ncbi:hypothetical protein LEP1GSC017_0752 [Leptospira meyeri serovar Hardjo str. Went 5]|nr:hypothetical protein LEP1GSC017_0752 [Leptospira meyeri serovar Hardjo str. Went 5]EMJ90133.1 hypothetical protein LEP1GSC196_2669 [Leptospira meyeri serovar Semaranga str. Veldrot Semarang 173]
MRLVWTVAFEFSEVISLTGSVEQENREKHTHKNKKIYF